MISTQSLNTCEDIVALTLICIDHYSFTPLYEFLAKDFRIEGQSGEDAKIVLDQVFHLNDTVVYIMPLSNVKTESTLTLTYSIEYKKIGIKEVTFIFDESNFLKELIIKEKSSEIELKKIL